MSETNIAIGIAGSFAILEFTAVVMDSMPLMWTSATLGILWLIYAVYSLGQNTELPEKKESEESFWAGKVQPYY